MVKLRRTQYEHMFSALLSNSDVARCSRHVSNVPIAEVARLFDHIVSPVEQDRRNRDVGLRRFEIINRRNGISVGVHEMDRKANAVARRPKA
jgi:hypothetical protein